MNKAISEIIIAVFIVFIAISLTSVIYLFMTSFSSETTAEVTKEKTSTFKRMGSCLEVVSFDNNTNRLYMRNCGRYDLKDISLIVDNIPQSGLNEIKQGEIKGVAVSTSIGEHEVSVVGDYASVTTFIDVTTYIGPQCSDGTPYSQCSATKPKYCNEGTLIDKCSECGCDIGYSCMIDETCVIFDFSLSASPATGSVNQGSSASTTVTATLISGEAELVSLSCSGLPLGASCSFSPTSCSGIYGDVNGNGKVDIGDLTKITFYLSGKTTLNDCEKIKADVDADGDITDTDETYIRNFVMGKSPYGRTGEQFTTLTPTESSTLTISTLDTTPSGTYTITITAGTRTTTYGLTVIFVCTGFEAHGYCWYAGTNGQSCTQVCASQGLTCSPEDWTDPECVVLKNFFTCSSCRVYPDACFPPAMGNNFCWYDWNGAASCDCAWETLARVCACI